MNKIFPTVVLSLALLGLAMLPLRQVLAATSFTVDSVLDEIDDDTSDGVCHSAASHCTLRAAIMQANHLTAPGVTTIIAPAGTYMLTRPASGANGDDNGDLNLAAPLASNQSIVITGAGAANTIIDANQIDGVIQIEQGRIATITGVAIRNGRRLAKAGGGILNRGKLTISDCVIEDNQADGNSGGGIASVATGNATALEVVRCSIRSNIGFFGGGMFVSSPTTVRNSTISSNAALYGGGIYNTDTIYIVNSTISQNTADSDGGGISNDALAGVVVATTALYNTSVIDNDADHDRDQNGGIGGGIYNAARTGNRFVVVN